MIRGPPTSLPRTILRLRRTRPDVNMRVHCGYDDWLLRVKLTAPNLVTEGLDRHVVLVDPSKKFLGLRTRGRDF